MLGEEVEHSSERQEVLAVLMEGKMNMQKIAPADFQRQIFQELNEVGGAEDKGSAVTCSTETQVEKMGRRKGKVGVVKGNGTVVRSPRQFLFCFVLILLGL